MKHKNAEFIKAWSDGVPIQYFFENKWVTIDPKNFYWQEGTQFRYVPETITETITDYSRLYITEGGVVMASYRDNPNLELVFNKDLGNLISAKVLN